MLKTILSISLLSTLLYTKTCKNPAVANDDLNKKFRYGCFCGENYPNIKHHSNKSYKDLNLSEKEELIAKYLEIEPFDDIDRTCQMHDICYIKYGKKAKICDENIVSRLSELIDEFSIDADKNVTKAQCRNLALKDFLDKILKKIYFLI